MLYSKRFPIESSFKSMKYDAAAFSGRFQSKFLPKRKRYEKSGAQDRVDKIKGERERKAVRKSLDATEGYVFCGVVATGFLQMLSLRNTGNNEISNTLYLRTPSRASLSEATVAYCLANNILAFSGRARLAHKRNNSQKNGQGCKQLRGKQSQLAWIFTRCYA